MRDLTINEALGLAVKEWGKSARVEREKALTSAEMERMRAGIRKEQEQIEAKRRPDTERCIFINDKGHRCCGKIGHDKVVGSTLAPHSCSASLEERIARQSAYWIDARKNGWVKIGKLALGLFFEVKAEAATFREAFAKHEERKAKERAEIERLRARLAQQMAALEKARAAKAAKRNGARFVAVGEGR